ncbi:MAG: hypothetical protein OEN23_10680 [Paracoccaceae bacterium]|nr:hypothetical protein [Paracoccaceae bacterium]
MYAEDSFYTLDWLRGAGLLVVTGVLVWLTWKAAKRVCRGGLARRLVWALGLFWAFLWLSPQIYYAYYWLIFPDLPVQWVIRWPPGPAWVGRLLAFQGPATLSAHGQGALGWALIIGAARRFRGV